MKLLFNQRFPVLIICLCLSMCLSLSSNLGLHLKLKLCSLNFMDLSLVDLIISRAEANEEINEVFYPNLEITDMQLSNGMRVCFKPTSFDSEEVLIRLSAPGGFALFSNKNRASAELASKVVLESGWGNFTADELSSLFYTKTIDFSLETKAFSHFIDGACDKESVKDFFILINQMFTRSHFTKEAYDKTLKQESEAINRRKLDMESKFEEAFLALNTQNLPVLNSLSLDDLKNAQFEKSREFYEKVFVNPSSYVCVIVGNLKLEEVRAYVNEYLVPLKKTSTPYDKTRFSVKFPIGVTKKHLIAQRKGEGMTRLTFPLVKPLTADNINAVELACQVIEARLRKIIFEKFHTTQGVDVAYEIPLFPSLDLAWITIQYRSPALTMSPIAKLILTQLDELQHEGLSPADFEAALLQQSQSDNYWLSDNDYWLLTLTNYSMLRWSPNYILKKTSAEVKFDDVKTVIKTFFPLSNYTMISSQTSF